MLPRLASSPRPGQKHQRQPGLVLGVLPLRPVGLGWQMKHDNLLSCNATATAQSSTKIVASYTNLMQTSNVARTHLPWTGQDNRCLHCRRSFDMPRAVNLNIMRIICVAEIVGSLCQLPEVIQINLHSLENVIELIRYRKRFFLVSSNT